jgi:hypothetical protein
MALTCSFFYRPAIEQTQTAIEWTQFQVFLRGPSHDSEQLAQTENHPSLKGNTGHKTTMNQIIPTTLRSNIRHQEDRTKKYNRNQRSARKEGVMHFYAITRAAGSRSTQKSEGERLKSGRSAILRIKIQH